MASPGDQATTWQGRIEQTGRDAARAGRLGRHDWVSVGTVRDHAAIDLGRGIDDREDRSAVVVTTAAHG
jgi:hypothetical protein